MAYKISIVEPATGISFNARYENLAHKKKAPVEAKAPNGNIVKERTTYQGQVLVPGSTQRQWADDDGNFYAKSELTFWYEGQEVSEIEQTKVFSIEGFQPLANYTDKYVIATYYEIFPCDNGMKKDYDRDMAVRANLTQMRKLWEKLNSEKVVARGEFNASSRGFIASDGYIRAITIDGTKWGLECGLFKEEKVFNHLQEGTPQEVVLPQKSKAKRIKMV
jgi:hypothetical protein